MRSSKPLPFGKKFINLKPLPTMCVFVGEQIASTPLYFDGPKVEVTLLPNAEYRPKKKVLKAPFFKNSFLSIMKVLLPLKVKNQCVQRHALSLFRIFL